MLNFNILQRKKWGGTRYIWYYGIYFFCFKTTSKKFGDYIFKQWK